MAVDNPGGQGIACKYRDDPPRTGWVVPVLFLGQYFLAGILFGRWGRLQCRRCDSLNLLKLEKKSRKDNDILRCRDCGFLFSPSRPDQARPDQPGPKGKQSRTVAISSGYKDRG